MDRDAAVGVSEERFADVFPRARSVVDGLGGLVESYHHKLTGLTLTHERIFAQYADRSQLDLVVYPATVFAGSIPNVVVLYDPDGLLAAPDGTAPELLDEVADQLGEEQRDALPVAMGRFITDDLRAAVAGVG